MKKSVRYFVAVLVTLSLLLAGCGRLCEQERSGVDSIRDLVDVAETDEQRAYAEERLIAAEAVLEDCEADAEADEDLCRRILLLVMKVGLELIETR